MADAKGAEVRVICTPPLTTAVIGDLCEITLVEPAGKLIGWFKVIGFDTDGCRKLDFIPVEKGLPS